MKVEKKTYTTEYWSCGLDKKGHHHKTEDVAERCAEKQRVSAARPPKIDLTERNRNFVLRWIECKNAAQVAKEFGVSYSVAKGPINRYARISERIVNQDLDGYTVRKWLHWPKSGYIDVYTISRELADKIYAINNNE